MAYQKQNWEDLPIKTTPFSAARMLHIEQGIYDASINANVDLSDYYNKEELNDLLAEKANVDTIPDTSNLANKTDLNNKQDKLSVDSDYLELINNTLTFKYDALLNELKNQFVSQVNGTTDSLWIGTQEEYNDIDSKNPKTTYIIRGVE